MKTTVKSLFMCVVSVFVAALAAFMSYVITLNMLKKSPAYEEKLKKEAEGISRSVSASSDVSPRLIGEGSEEHDRFKLYKVRLEDDVLNVYVNYEKHEEFLYGEKINVLDLSEEDRKILTEGKTFEEMGKLTEFTENFTS